MQLTRIKQLTATLTLKTGLHIGAGDTEMRIGGTDNPVVKNPLDGQPYIPGSSLKGKIRSLLEWQLGLVGISNPGQHQQRPSLLVPAPRHTRQPGSTRSAAPVRRRAWRRGRPTGQ